MRHNSKVFLFVLVCFTSAMLNIVTAVMELGRITDANLDEKKFWIIVGYVAFLAILTYVYVKAEEKTQNMLIFWIGIAYSVGASLGLYIFIYDISGQDVQVLYGAYASLILLGIMLIGYNALLKRNKRVGQILLGVYGGICFNMINNAFERLGQPNLINFEKFEQLPKSRLAIIIGTIIIVTEIIINKAQNEFSDFARFLQSGGYFICSALPTYVYAVGVPKQVETIVYSGVMAAVTIWAEIHYQFNAEEIE